MKVKRNSVEKVGHLITTFTRIAHDKYKLPINLSSKSICFGFFYDDDGWEYFLKRFSYSRPAKSSQWQEPAAGWRRSRMTPISRRFAPTRGKLSFRFFVFHFLVSDATHRIANDLQRVCDAKILTVRRSGKALRLSERIRRIERNSNKIWSVLKRSIIIILGNKDFSWCDETESIHFLFHYCRRSPVGNGFLLFLSKVW